MKTIGDGLKNGEAKNEHWVREEDADLTRLFGSCLFPEPIDVILFDSTK